MGEKDAKLAALTEERDALRAELESGGHENRTFVEIATKQAKREGMIESEVEAARVATRRLQGAIKTRDAEMADLASQLLAAQTRLRDEKTTERRENATNLEYVKNVVVQFMSLAPGTSEHASLVPVLATVLQFDADDVALLRGAALKHEAAQRPAWPLSLVQQAPPSPYLALKSTPPPKPRTSARRAS